MITTGLIAVLVITALAIPLKFAVPKRPVPVKIDVTATGCDMIAFVPGRVK